MTLGRRPGFLNFRGYSLLYPEPGGWRARPRGHRSIASETNRPAPNREYAMNDPYRLTAGTPGSPGSGAARAGVLRPFLWVVLVISAIGNAVASYAGATTRAHLAFGSVTALCAAVLVAHRLGVPRPAWQGRRYGPLRRLWRIPSPEAVQTPPMVRPPAHPCQDGAPAMGKRACQGVDSQQAPPIASGDDHWEFSARGGCDAG